ncbi:hypothetical protein [Flocculibacter collagenilyticus]|uniref:hypothetical protein n=1 Tax=Flocculibacter collagenilyticus TaxID=2744479 RepID=UPI0018F34ACE|nr:hypothetical protein [Flocculibacter collagenilyticus]
MRFSILLTSMLAIASFNLHAKSLVTQKADITACIQEIKQNLRPQSCRFEILQNHNAKDVSRTRQDASKIARKFRQLLSSLSTENERINLAFEALTYLNNRQIIKPFIVVVSKGNEQVITVVVKYSENDKSGYGINLTMNTNESIVFLNLLASDRYIANNTYINDIRKVLLF